MFSVVTLIGGFTTVALQYVVKGSMDMGSASVIGLKNLVVYAVLVHIFLKDHITVCNILNMSKNVLRICL